jgi:hypothetical protein
MKQRLEAAVGRRAFDGGVGHEHFVERVLFRRLYQLIEGIVPNVPRGLVLEAEVHAALELLSRVEDAEARRPVHVELFDVHGGHLERHVRHERQRLGQRHRLEVFRILLDALCPAQHRLPRRRHINPQEPLVLVLGLVDQLFVNHPAFGQDAARIHFCAAQPGCPTWSSSGAPAPAAPAPADPSLGRRAHGMAKGRPLCDDACATPSATNLSRAH